MRLHANSKEARHYTAYCDGEKLEKCFYASEEDGVAKCYVGDENGRTKIAPDGQSLETVTVYGKIELVRVGE